MNAQSVFSGRIGRGARTLAALGLMALAGGCRNQCHHFRLIEVNVPGQRDCACRTGQAAPNTPAPPTTPGPTAPAPAAPASPVPVPPELAPAASKPGEDRPHSILASKSPGTSPAGASRFSSPGTRSVVSHPAPGKARPPAQESSSRRVNVYTGGTNAGTGIAGARRPDNTTDVVEPELIAQLPVQLTADKPDVADEKLAELDSEILADTEPLATPAVVDEIHGPLLPAAQAPKPATPPPAAATIADEATRIVAGIATTAAASAAELKIDAAPTGEPIEAAVVVSGPVILRAIAPDSMIRPVGVPATGSGLHAIPVGFQRTVPAPQPSAPAGFPVPGSAQPLGPTLLPQPVFRELPFHEPATRILKATADAGEAPGGQPALSPQSPAVSVANSASIVNEPAAPGTQR